MTKKFLLFMTLLLSCIGYARAQEVLTVYEGTTTSEFVPAYINYWENFTRSQVVFSGEKLSDMTGGAISAMTFYTNKTEEYVSASTADVYLMEVDYTSISAFEPKSSGDIVYQGTLTVNANGTLTIEFDSPYDYHGGNLLVGIENTTDAGYKNINFFGQTVSGASIAGYNSNSLDAVPPRQRNFIPKTTFTYTPDAPAVAKPKNLAVDYTDGTTAMVSWTSDASSFDIDVNGAVTEDVSNPYTLTDLDLATTYAVKVRAKIGTDMSHWTKPVSFMTDFCLPEDQCVINITLTDSYGDGWEGNKLQVVDDETGGVIGTYTIAEQVKSASYSLNVCNGSTINFMFVASGSYSSENGWIITDVNDKVIAEREGCESEGTPTSGLICSYLVDCTTSPAQKPTDLAVSNVTYNSAELSWTENGEATQWEIALNDDEENVIAADSNPFTMTGLTPETAYTAKVRAVVGEEKSKWSDAVSFTTLVQFAEPTDVAASNVTNNSADISWTGDADSYNLRYRTSGVIFSEDFEGGSSLPDGWTAIDADGDGHTWYIFTQENGEDDQGNPIVFDASCATSASYHQGVVLTPDNWLVSPQIDLQGTLSLWVRAQDPSWTDEKFAIYLSTTGTDVKDFTNVLVEESTATGEYVEYTADLNAYIGQKGYIAIRHFDCRDMYRLNVDNITITCHADEWITVNNVNSSYTLTGLDYGTSYQVEVQAVYADGESSWVGTVFTTPLSNPLPTNVVVSDITQTSATISWEGQSDGYMVKYRKAASQEKFFFEDFENGLPDTWTTIDNDGDGNNWGSLETIVDGNGNPTGFGENLVTSASFDKSGRALTPDNWLITPQIDLQGTMSVWLRGQDPAYAEEHFAIYVSTTGNTVADFTKGGTVIVPETTAADVLTEYTYDLSAYTGQQGYIAIRHFNCTDMFSLNVDNFAILGNEIPAGDWIVVETGDTSVDLTGLEMGTEYEYTVIGIKDGEENAGTPVASFITNVAITLANDDSNATEKNSDIIGANVDKKVDVILSDRTLFKDGSWNTLCLPFDVTLEGSVLEGATAKTLSDATIDDTSITLTFGEAVDTLTAGTPYIIKWDAADENIIEPIFTKVTISSTESQTIEKAGGNVKFTGYYDAFDITADDGIYYMKANNTLAYSGTNRTLKALRAYFQFAKSESARTFVLDFGDGSQADGIGNIPAEMFGQGDWYTPSGIKVGDRLPTRKGIYVNNGKKVVIK